MENKEYTAEELCHQYMRRAKETITTAGYKLTFVGIDKDAVEAVIETLSAAKTDIGMAIFQIGRMYEQNKGQIRR